MLLVSPWTTDEASEVLAWSWMLGHLHRRIILPPSVEANTPTAKLSERRRSHDEGVDLLTVVRLDRLAQRRIRFFRCSCSECDFPLLIRNGAGFRSRSEKGISEKQVKPILGKVSSRRSPRFVLGPVFHRSQCKQQGLNHGRKWGEGLVQAVCGFKGR